MALLDFKCDNCGEKFFELVRSMDKEVVKCPKCSGNKVSQVFEGKSVFSSPGRQSTAHKHGG